jgi:hypothetical protein
MIENKQKVTLNFLKNLKRKIHNNFFKFKQKPILLVVDSIQTDMCGVCLVVGAFLLVWKGVVRQCYFRWEMFLLCFTSVSVSSSSFRLELE